MPRSDEHIVIVLGAGRGRRMGGPKALMTVTGEPWWRHQQRRLKPLALPVVWVFSPDVAQTIRDSPDAPTSIVETDDTAPMFDSVLAGLREGASVSPAGVFLHPIDCPAPAPSVWRRLSEHGPICVPRFAGTDGHPLFLDWDWVKMRLLTGDLAPEERRLDALTRPLRRHIEVDDRDVIVNLNSPDALVSWLASNT